MTSYIEMAEKKAGRQVDLAKIMETRPSTLRLAKTGNRPLPNYLCYRLAAYLEIDVGLIIAESNLITERDENKRKIYKEYLKNKSVL